MRADPLSKLAGWIDDARRADQPHPDSVAFVTVDDSGRPSARTVALKRIEQDALVFTTALWTRKARDMRANPQVALLFHWAGMGRQAQIGGQAQWASREISVELFGERERVNQYQALVSRQGEPIDDLQPLRDRLAHLQQIEESPPSCPPDWGAVRVVPDFVEFWTESPDRLHDRLVYERQREGGWRELRLAP